LAVKAAGGVGDGVGAGGFAAGGAAATGLAGRNGFAAGAWPNLGLTDRAGGSGLASLSGLDGGGGPGFVGAAGKGRFGIGNFGVAGAVRAGCAAGGWRTGAGASGVGSADRGGAALAVGCAAPGPGAAVAAVGSVSCARVDAPSTPPTAASTFTTPASAPVGPIRTTLKPLPAPLSDPDPIALPGKPSPGKSSATISTRPWTISETSSAWRRFQRGKRCIVSRVHRSAATAMSIVRPITARINSPFTAPNLPQNRQATTTDRAW
jgi:hypothetical protein